MPLKSTSPSLVATVESKTSGRWSKTRPFVLKILVVQKDYVKLLFFVEKIVF